MTKYRNTKRVCGQDHKHDSIKEAGYCDQLALLLKAGEILGYEVHKTFELQPKFKYGGKTIRAITIKPDFVVYWDGGTEIVDVKGGKATQTRDWKNKWKMLMYLHRNEPGVYRFTVV